MTVVVLFYRTNFPYSVKTRPWHVWANRLPKPLEELQLLLISEHQFASGQTLKLEFEEAGHDLGAIFISKSPSSKTASR
jgi:hypothetical protein